MYIDSALDKTICLLSKTAKMTFFKQLVSEIQQLTNRLNTPKIKIHCRSRRRVRISLNYFYSSKLCHIAFWIALSVYYTR